MKKRNKKKIKQLERKINRLEIDNQLLTTFYEHIKLRHPEVLEIEVEQIICEHLGRKEKEGE